MCVNVLLYGFCTGLFCPLVVYKETYEILFVIGIIWFCWRGVSSSSTNKVATVWKCATLTKPRVSKQDCDDLAMCCGQSIWSCIFVLWQWRLILLFLFIYLYCYYSISNSINSCNSTYYAILDIMDTKMLSWIVIQKIRWPQRSHKITSFFKHKQEIVSGALLGVTNDNMYFN